MHYCSLYCFKMNMTVPCRFYKNIEDHKQVKKTHPKRGLLCFNGLYALALPKGFFVVVRREIRLITSGSNKLLALLPACVLRVVVIKAGTTLKHLQHPNLVPISLFLLWRGSKFRPSEMDVAKTPLAYCC